MRKNPGIECFRPKKAAVTPSTPRCSTVLRHLLFLSTSRYLDTSNLSGVLPLCRSLAVTSHRYLATKASLFKNVAEWYSNRSKSTHRNHDQSASPSPSTSPTKSKGRRLSRGSRKGSLKKLSQTSSTKSLFSDSQSPEPILEAGGKFKSPSPTPPSKRKPKSKMGRTKSTEAAAKLQKEATVTPAQLAAARDANGRPVAETTMYGVQVLLPGIPGDAAGTADAFTGIAGVELAILEKNAVLIQSAWRGSLARAEVDEMRANAAELAAEAGGDPAEQHAATIIQAATRGHLSRLSTGDDVSYTATAPASSMDGAAWDSATSYADESLDAAPNAAAAKGDADGNGEEWMEGERDTKGQKPVKVGSAAEPPGSAGGYPPAVIEEQLTTFFR